MVPEFDEWVTSRNVNRETMTPEAVQALESVWRAEVKLDEDRRAARDEYDPGEGYYAHGAVQTAFEESTARNLDANSSSLAMLRASRSAPPLYPPRGAGGRGGPELLEASLCMSLGLPDRTVASFYGDRITDAATKSGMRNIGYHGVMRHILAANGRHVPSGSITTNDIREVFDISRSLRAGVGAPSTYSLPGILGNVQNKLALASFMETQTTWSKFCKPRDAKDFKALASYRLHQGGRLLEVAPGGEIQHATLSESSFANQVKTYGRLIAITRTDLVNDDLGVLASVPPLLGSMGAKTLERAVYTLLLANTGSFFAAGNANLLTGGGSVLALAGLDDAIEAFTEQKDVNNDPTLIAPRVLLVPPALAATARSIINSTKIVATTTANAGIPDGNPFAGLLEVVSSPYLGVTIGLTGNSDTAWYVLAAPGDNAIIEVAFLNGVQTPMVETSEMDFNVLGIAMRVVFDFGVGFQEPKGGVKSAGA